MAKVLDNAFTGLGVQAVGFRYIAGETSRNGFFDGYFADYVLQRRGEAKADPEFCDPEKYWLGYWQAFHPIPPSLTHMLRVLAASAEPAAAAHFVDCLEGQDTCG